MGIKQTLIRLLLNRLPADEQARMVADVIAWLYADLPPARRQEKIERLGPGLMEMIRQGRLGLPLLVYHHLLRLPPLRWLPRPPLFARGCSHRACQGRVDPARPKSE
ncbi:MAG: hypothetical protein PVF45_01935 [Anaerolineae bacterium]|jgi:hypothetical protein